MSRWLENMERYARNLGQEPAKAKRRPARVTDRKGLTPDQLYEIRKALVPLPRGPEHRRVRRELAVKFNRTEDAITVVVRKMQAEGVAEAA